MATGRPKVLAQQRYLYHPGLPCRRGAPAPANPSRQGVLAKQRARAFYLVTRVTGCVPPRCQEPCYLGKPGLQHQSLSLEVTEHPVRMAGVGGQGLAWEGH